ncbi:unnamed protein product [Effrenium voratum]|nr:unnamed protein product [Effrenium voratum]
MARIRPRLGAVLCAAALAICVHVADWCLPRGRILRRCYRKTQVLDETISPSFLPALEKMESFDGEASSVLPCFPLQLLRAALPGSKRTLNVLEPRYAKMYQDLIKSGKRRFVVPRYVQTPQGVQLAEAAVVFLLTDIQDAPPGARFRYTCHHKVLRPVHITKVLNPADFAKKSTYLQVECQEVLDSDSEEDLTAEEEDLVQSFHEVAALCHAIGHPLRRWEYMTDRHGRCQLVDHGPSPFPEESLNTASATRDTFWDLAQLWQGYCDRRAVALRQQHDRDVQAVRRSGSPKAAQMLKEIGAAFEAETQEHWEYTADLMQALLQCEGHHSRLAVLGAALRREMQRLAAVSVVAACTGGEAQA